VPARNTVFLALALGWAEVLGARDIFIGVNALDYSGYPDCRPEYIAAFERLASLATAAGVQGGSFRVHAPLQMLTKAEIIRKGQALGLDYGLTHSCYDPLSDGSPCGRCDSCQLRATGFAQAGMADPLGRPIRVRANAVVLVSLPSAPVGDSGWPAACTSGLRGHMVRHEHVPRACHGTWRPDPTGRLHDSDVHQPRSRLSRRHGGEPRRQP
jgi:hypothetical protein